MLKFLYRATWMAERQNDRTTKRPNDRTAENDRMADDNNRTTEWLNNRTAERQKSERHHTYCIDIIHTLVMYIYRFNVLLSLHADLVPKSIYQKFVWIRQITLKRKHAQSNWKHYAVKCVRWWNVCEDTDALDHKHECIGFYSEMFHFIILLSIACQTWC